MNSNNEIQGYKMYPMLHFCRKFSSGVTPPIDEQDRLLHLYFTHVHPPFPVIHKAAFWDAWNNRFVSLSFLFFLVFHTLLSIDSHLSPLLLFAMFSIAARYDAPIMYSPLPPPQNPVPSPLPLSQQTVSPHGPPAKITSFSLYSR